MAECRRTPYVRVEMKLGCNRERCAPQHVACNGVLHTHYILGAGDWTRIEHGLILLLSTVLVSGWHRRLRCP
jgi:hypothetical protein